MRLNVVSLAFGLFALPHAVLAQESTPAAVPVVKPVAAPVVAPTSTLPAVVAQRPVYDVVTPMPVPRRVPVFGQPGQFTVGGSTSMTVNGAHLANRGQQGDAFALSLSPKAAYFLSPYLLVGGRFDLSYNQASGQKNLTLGVGPTIAGHLAVTDRVSFLPELAATYGYSHLNNPALALVQKSHNVLLRLSLTTAFHLAPHLSVTAAPIVEQSVLQKVAGLSRGSLTRYGAQFGVLVWF